MPKTPLAAIVEHCDRILRTPETGDYEGAVNGLQVENSGTVTRLAAALGLKNRKPFFESHGQKIGFQSRQKISRNELAKKLERATGAKPLLIPGGKEICERIGIVTGGAGGELKQAASEGVDTFITGEGPHWTYALAEELGLNVFYGGHYATETFGVQALAAELSKKFKLPWEFLDHPTGL
jgi:putative NIF3 family GTP cyclohydrolase 1 type 2